MEAFLTGSHAYGEPTAESDIDLALLMTAEECDIFASGCDEGSWDDEYGPSDAAAFVFGGLNVIAFTSREQFDAWKTATAELVARRPVRREEAVALIKEKLSPFLAADETEGVALEC